jgi:nucleoside-diphosphate-sugar epimerase
VVHLAGMAHLPLDNREMRRRLRRINVESTQHLAQAAAAHGVSTFIFMSSIRAIGDHSSSGPLTETSPPRPEDCYGMAKLAAERRLQRIGRSVDRGIERRLESGIDRGSSGMRILVLRPPLVYGPGVRANFAALVRWVGSGLPLPLGGIRNRRSLIYVGNLTSAVVRCLQRRDVPSGTFHLSDDEAVTTPELARAIARAQDCRVRLPGLPVSLLRVAAKAFGREAWLSRLVGSLEVSNAHFCRSFDWRPPFSLDEGLRATLSDGLKRPAER